MKLVQYFLVVQLCTSCGAVQWTYFLREVCGTTTPRPFRIIQLSTISSSRSNWKVLVDFSRYILEL